MMKKILLTIITFLPVVLKVAAVLFGTCFKDNQENNIGY